MNDEFLYRLRQPPPAAFAARLRARLESQGLARRFRRRQITLYSLIACLLGSTAVALVVPGVREATRAMIREVLPRFPNETSQPSVQAQPTAVRSTARTASQPSHLAQPVASRPLATSSRVGISAPGRTMRQSPPPSATGGSYVAGGRGALPASVESRPEAQITVIGHGQAAQALFGAATELRNLNRDARVGVISTTNNRVFSRFCAGEGDIAVATRMITPSELEECRRYGSEVTALPIAYEALAVLANPLNDWVSGLRREDLKLLFDRSAGPNTLAWSQIDQRWPPSVVEPAAPAPQARFAQTFSELILRVTPAQHPGSGGLISNEEMRLVRQVQRTLHGLTYLPYSVYLEFDPRPAVRLVPIVNASDVAVVPSRASITDGSYELARPMLLFIRRRAERAAGVETFVGLVLTTAERRLAGLGFLALSRAETELAVVVLRDSGEGLSALDPTTLEVRSARELLLQQLPPHRRERARLKLESN